MPEYRRRVRGCEINNIIIATDADVDGMHIRLLMMTFFLQFSPDLVKNKPSIHPGNALVQGPDKQKPSTVMMKTKNRRNEKLGNKPETTRFKGLGEISPEEFSRLSGPRCAFSRC
jgi:topoisomerase-4 subunit B